MRKAIVIAVALIPYLPAAGQGNPVTKRLEVNAAVPVRDAAFERTMLARHRTEAAALSPAVRDKLSLAADSVIRRLATTSGEADFSSIAHQEVQRQFGSVSARQSDFLASYVLADVGKTLGSTGSIKDKLDSMNEMSEMTSLRLQMYMDRRSKFLEALSNLMKKSSDTQGSITQNLK